MFNVSSVRNQLCSLKFHFTVCTVKTHNSVRKFSYHIYFNPNQSNVELHTPALSVVPVQCLAQIDMLFDNYICWFFFYNLLPSDGCFLNFEDYEIFWKINLDQRVRIYNKTLYCKGLMTG